MDNCDWAATSAALAHVNPDFLMSIIHDNGDNQSATFDIWEFPSLVKKPQTVYKKDLPSNANNKGTEWSVQVFTNSLVERRLACTSQSHVEGRWLTD